MLKKHLSIILIFALLPTGMTCKPRTQGSNFLSEEANEEKKAVNIAYFYLNRTEARNNPALYWLEETAINQVDEILKRTREASTYKDRYIGASTIADMMAVAPIWIKMTPEAKQKRNVQYDRISSVELVGEALKAFKAPSVGKPGACVDYSKPMPQQTRNYQFQYCSDFTQCSDAVTYITSFTRVDWGDSFIARDVDQVMQAIQKDISCVDGQVTRQMLSYKWRAAKVWQKFNQLTSMEAPANMGKLPRITPAAHASLKSEVSSLLDDIESKFMHKSMDNAVPVDLALKFMLDEVISENVLPKGYREKLQAEIEQDKQKAQRPFGRDQSYYKRKMEAVVAAVTKEDMEGIQAITDFMLGSVAQVYDTVLRLRIYLDRINQRNIKPWVSCLQDRVKNYIEQFNPQFPNRMIRHLKGGSGSNACIQRPIRPSVAFRTLTAFMRQELLLPQRHFYFQSGIQYIGRAMLNNTKNQFVAVDKTGMDPVSKAIEMASFLIRHTDATNAEMYALLAGSNPKYFPPYRPVTLPPVQKVGNKAAYLNAVYEEQKKALKVFDPFSHNHPVLGSDPNKIPYEQRMSENINDFHSLFYQLHDFMNRTRELQRSYTIQRCKMGDTSLTDNEKLEFCQPAGLWKKNGDQFLKKKGEAWVEVTPDEKKQAHDKLAVIQQEMMVQTARQACAQFDYGNQNVFRRQVYFGKGRGDKAKDKNWIHLIPERKPELNEWVGCWDPLVYQLNTRNVVEGLMMTSPLYWGMGLVKPMREMRDNYQDYSVASMERLMEWTGNKDLNRSYDSSQLYFDFYERSFGDEPRRFASDILERRFGSNENLFPAADGYFNMNHICKRKETKDQNGDGRPDVFMSSYTMEINRWLTAQKNHDKCKAVSMEFATLILSAVTMPLIGTGAHMIVGRFLTKAPSVIATVSRTYPALQTEASLGRLALARYLYANPHVMKAIAGHIVKYAPRAMAELTANAVVFALLNKAMYRILWLQPLAVRGHDGQIDWMHTIGHEIIMGLWFMGLMPKVHGLSNAIFPRAITKVFKPGVASATLNFTASVGVETAFFRYIGPVAEKVMHKAKEIWYRVAFNEELPEEPDTSYLDDKGELYEWGHALMMTLVFRVSRPNMQQNHQAVWNAHMARMNMRHYQLRRRAGLPAYDPYSKARVAEQNPMTDLGMTAEQWFGPRRAEIANKRWQEINKEHGGDAHQGQNPKSMIILNNAAHAVQIANNPAAVSRLNPMMKKFVKETNNRFKKQGQEPITMKDISGEIQSIYWSTGEYYQRLGITDPAYQPSMGRPGKPFGNGFLNGRLQASVRGINAEITRQTNLMNRYPKNSPKRQRYQTEIDALRQQKKEVEFAHKMLSENRQIVDTLASDPVLQQIKMDAINEMEGGAPYPLDTTGLDQGMALDATGR